MIYSHIRSALTTPFTQSHNRDTTAPITSWLTTHNSAALFTEQFRYDARGRIAQLTPSQGGGFVRTWWQGLADALPFAYTVSIIPAGGGSGGGGNTGENPPGSSAYPSWLAADDLTFAVAGEHALVADAEWESTFMLPRNHRGDTVAVVEPNGTFREVYVYGLWGDSTVFGCTTSSGSGTATNTCTIPKSNSTLGNSSQMGDTLADNHPCYMLGPEF